MNGSLDALANMSQLRELFLYTTAVTGSLEALSKLTFLCQVSLFYHWSWWIAASLVESDVHERLDYLQHSHQRLAGISGINAVDAKSQIVRYRCPRVLEALDAMFQMRELMLLLSDLASMLQLERLWLQSTSISGALASLSNIAQLYELISVQHRSQRLFSRPSFPWSVEPAVSCHTQITGSAEALSNVPFMSECSISNTQIYSSLDSLSSLRGMTRLQVSGTFVSGSRL